MVFNPGIAFQSEAGERFDVVNAADSGLCLKRHEAPEVTPGHPVSGRPSWPEKSIEKDVRGVICRSRSVDDGDMFYGVHADVFWPTLGDAPQLEIGDGIP